MWNPQLAEFVDDYGGKKMQYKLQDTQEVLTIEFCERCLIVAGRKYGIYNLAVEYLGEELSPVGSCENGNIYLLLTVSGRLFGFDDYLLLTWMPDDFNWRDSIRKLLAGDDAIKHGLID